MSHSRIYLLLILLLAVVLRLVTFLTASAIEMDGVVYARMGEAFSQGNFGEALKGVFPPFYPALIGLFHLFVPDLEHAGRLVSLVAGVSLVGASFFFFRELVDQGKALWGSFFVAIHPYLIRSSGQVLSESVTALLFTCTVFFFYLGWTRSRGWELALSGVFLSFTYLTRPEYVVYAVPLVLILIASKRYSFCAFFLFAFFCLVAGYLIYMRMETGLIVVSKKALLMKTAGSNGAPLYLIPMPSVLRTLQNIPVVVYHLIEAISLPLVALLLLGWRWMEKRFRILTLFLVVSHVLSIALLTSSNRRFSVPFAAFIMVFATEGLVSGWAWVKSPRHGRALAYAFLGATVGLCLFQAIDLPNSGRGLNKEAGLFLQKTDPGSRILSRLPLVAFYSHGQWVNTQEQLGKGTDCRQLTQIAKDKGVKYLILDEKMEQEKTVPDSCLSTFTDIAEFKKGQDFVRVYRFDG